MKYESWLIGVGESAAVDKLVEAIGQASQDGYAFKAVIRIPRQTRAMSNGIAVDTLVFEDWLLYERPAPENAREDEPLRDLTHTSYTDGDWRSDGWILFRNNISIADYVAKWQITLTATQLRLLEEGYAYGTAHPESTEFPKDWSPTNG